MGQKVLLTGGRGLLAEAIEAYLSSSFTVSAFDRAEFDITNLLQVQKVLKAVKPDIIIHCAAMTNVDLCESQHELTNKTNVLGTQYLAQSAHELNPNTQFVYISSTGVYGAHKAGPYQEQDSVQPTTVYHRTKYEGEIVAQKACVKTLILRVGWLYGGRAEQPRNFVMRRYHEANGQEFIYGDPTQYGNPTYIGDVAKQLSCLLRENAVGLFNCVGEGVASRFEYVNQIIKEFGLSTKVVVASAQQFKRAAPVSYNESAENAKLNKQGICLMPPWQESLSRYIQELRKSL